MSQIQHVYMSPAANGTTTLRKIKMFDGQNRFTQGKSHRTAGGYQLHIHTHTHIRFRFSEGILQIKSPFSFLPFFMHEFL